MCVCICLSMCVIPLNVYVMHKIVIYLIYLIWLICLDEEIATPTGTSSNTCILHHTLHLYISTISLMLEFHFAYISIPIFQHPFIKPIMSFLATPALVLSPCPIIASLFLPLQTRKICMASVT